MSLANYFFIPTVREGLATRIATAANANAAAIGQRASIPVRVTARAGNDTAPIDKTLQLFGPGDVLGFDASMITRTDPRPKVGNFESNFFPMVEFAEPDFPWRYTAAVADGANGGRLAPWLTLVALVAEQRTGGGAFNPEFTDAQTDRNQVPRIVANIAALPDLAEAWRWAHVQVTAPDNAAIDQDELQAQLDSNPERVVSRLVCARRLRPGTLYNAFIVPTFKLGCIAAGAATAAQADHALTPAWDKAAPNPTVTLPYYFRWEFRTGALGDFEYLVRLLVPRVLGDLGKRPMDADDPGYGMMDLVERAGVDASLEHVLELEGALRSPGLVPTLWGHDHTTPEGDSSSNATAAPEITPFHEALAANLLNREPANLDHGATAPAIPSVVPPIYGRWHAGRRTVWTRANDAAGDPGTPPSERWIDHMNLDPRHRAAAGYGAIVVENQQEQLMASAWDQLGSIDDANEVLRRAQVGLEASNSIFRRLQRLELSDFLTIAAPASKRVLTTGGDGKPLTVDRYLKKSNSPIPAAALDPAFRRIKRSRGPIRRNQGEAVSLDPPRDFLERFNNGTLSAAGGAPKPPGMPGLCDISATLAPPAPDVDPPDGKLPGDDDRGPLGGASPGPLGGAPTGALGGSSTNVRGGSSTDVRGGVTGRPASSGRTGTPSTSSGRSPTRGTDAGSSTGAASARFCEKAITCQMIEDAVRDLHLSDTIRVKTTKVKDVVDGVTHDLCDLTGANSWLHATTPTPSRPPLDLGLIKAVLADGIDPETTIPARAMQRLRLDQSDSRQTGTLGLVAAAVDFPQPMYEPLRDISQDLVLPGVERVPDNTLAVLTPNRRFIESYMVGLNHSFSAETQWRGAPLSVRNTAFRQFWDIRGCVPPDREGSDEFKDITPLVEWTADSTLGAATHDPHETPPSEEPAVLLVRGELLKKYPNTLVYAIEGRSVDGTAETRYPPLMEHIPKDSTGALAGRDGPGEQPGAHIVPIFTGSLKPDLNFFGFPFSTDDARGLTVAYPDGIYFGIEELPSEARFGLDLPPDEASPLPAPSADWENGHWNQFQPAPAQAFMPFPVDQYIDGRQPDDAAPNIKWNTSAGTIAWITLQRPVRIVVHATQMLPETTVTSNQ